MQHVIEEKSPRVPQNNFGWRLVDFGLKSPLRYIIGIRASKDTHGCRNYTLKLPFVGEGCVMNEPMITGCQPDSRNSTVRDERGACGNVGYGMG